MKPRTRSSRPTGRDPSQRITHARRFLAALLKAQRRFLRRAFARPPSADPTPTQSLQDLVENRELIATILLTIPSAGAILLTYRGASIPLGENGAEIAHKGDALAFAVAIGVLVWLGWAFLFSLIPRLRGPRLAGALAAGTIYVTTVACIDAPFNMLALGGAPAVQMSMIDTASHYEAERISAFARTTAARRLIISLRTQAQSFKASEAQELKGAQTGDPKPGKVSAAFGQVGKLLGDLADELEKSLAKADALQGDITAALARMKKAAHEQGPIRARVQAVSTEADTIDELLGRLAQLDMTVSIKATLTSLGTAVPVPTKATKPFQIVQNEQLALIAERARAVAKILQEALAELPAGSSAPPKSARPADPMTAIKTYWWPLLPQWIAALFVDLAPALLLFILIAGRREAARARESSPILGVAS